VINDTPIGERTVTMLLEQVAARQPTPGGGAVAAVTVSLASALGEMVLRYRLGDTGADGSLHGEALETMGRLGSTALALADADARAFEKLSALWKLSKDDPQRRAEWPDAVAGAIDAPQRILATGLEVLTVLDRVRESVGSNLRSDLAIAALLARSGAEAAAWNVRVNLPQVGDEDRATGLEQDTARSLERAAALCDAIEQTCRRA
jgi:formiminotetrahydrofolate cyclodeaminase